MREVSYASLLYFIYLASLTIVVFNIFFVYYVIEDHAGAGEGFSEEDDAVMRNNYLRSASQHPLLVNATVAGSGAGTGAMNGESDHASLVAPQEFTKRLVAAALVTLIYEGCLGHIFEFLKISMQTSEPGTRYTDIIKNITSNKGILGLWDGFVPWGVIQAIAKGGVFGLAHSVAKSYLTPLSDKGLIPELLALTLAGGIAGGFQGYVLSPTLLLKTRVMTNPIFREKMSLWRTTVSSFAIGFEVVKNEGLWALMKGSNIFALKRVFDWSTRYFFSDFFESNMKMMQYEYLYGESSSFFGGASIGGGKENIYYAHVLSPTEKIVASLLGGVFSTIVTLPLDVIVAKAQDAKKAGVKVSVRETFMKDYREGGFRQLYEANTQGFGVRLLHVCMTTFVMKTGSGMMYNFLFGGH